MLSGIGISTLVAALMPSKYLFMKSVREHHDREGLMYPTPMYAFLTGRSLFSMLVILAAA